MDRNFVILLMLFCHVIADYNLQGWLASAKQKSWWEKNSPGKMYENDYIMALFIHSFSWTFIIMLPIAYYIGFKVDAPFLLMFGINVAIHNIVDDMKANKKWINLCVDQAIHISQILLTSTILLAL